MLTSTVKYIEFDFESLDTVHGRARADDAATSIVSTTVPLLVLASVRTPYDL